MKQVLKAAKQLNNRKLQFSRAEMSCVWSFFKVSEEDPRYAVCNDCEGRVMRGGVRVKSFNTTNLITHLKNKHPEAFKEYEKLTNAKQRKKSDATMAAAPVGSPIEQVLEKTKKFHKDHQKQKALTVAIAKMIAVDDQPFSVVEDEGFSEVLEVAEPRYNKPSRRYFADVALPALHDIVATHIHKLLDSNVNDISFTTDIWSSDLNQTSMLSLTAQWIDKNFEMKRAVLHAQEFPGSHTGTAIASAFDSMFKEWRIRKENVHVVLRDNTRNMVKAMEECGVKSLGCMAHLGQLAVHDAVLSQRSVVDSLAIARKIVGHFKSSPLGTSRLRDIQREIGMKTKMLQQDVPTRWNSTFMMMTTLLEQKRALVMYEAYHGLPVSLNVNQWSLIEKMTTLLAPFEELTREISSHTATAADVIPSVVALKRFLNKTAETDSGVKTTKSALLEAVNKRFETSFSEQLYYLATILDPRYKDRYFDADLKLVAKNKLEKEVDKMTPSATAEPTPDAEEGEPQEKRMCTPSEGHSFLDMFDEILEEKEQDEQATGPTSVQVHGYLTEPTIPRNVSPLQYWQSNMTRFPALAPVARKYLSAPCTSVDSERLFSAASNVVSEKRNRIGTERAEMLLFVKHNIRLLPKPGKAKS
ncbi:Zinc finger BED domain-containing protein 4 [Merluccius polli]|uniref:Zinc finger BED domain-containing protein 4 n=1 Tax=Merluccius polli TaxID=89951 RepID=A0AA47MVR8_MERPO|nr:Zinc finger BED domain-containing protein 4 [Merluccius polli]